MKTELEALRTGRSILKSEMNRLNEQLQSIFTSRSWRYTNVCERPWKLGVESLPDRDAMGFVASTEGIKARMFRDLMVTAVEHRFGPINR